MCIIELAPAAKIMSGHFGLLNNNNNDVVIVLISWYNNIVSISMSSSRSIRQRTQVGWMEKLELLKGEGNENHRI